MPNLLSKNLRSKFNCFEALLAAAEKFGVKVDLISKDQGLRLFRKGKKEVFVKRHVPDLNSYVAVKVSASKALIKKVLDKNNIPNPKGWVLEDIKKALDLVDKGEIKFPVVVKPIDGCSGHAVTIEVKDKKCLVEAIKKVFEYNIAKRKGSNYFLIEEYLEGDDFRILVLDGKVLTSSCRKPAYVEGDGKKTIRELIKEYNSQPGVGKDLALCPIVRDFEFEKNLRENNLTEESVIEKDKIVYLRKNANISTGGRSFECNDKVNSKYKELAIKIAKLFNLRFCAVDLIAKDIRKFEEFGIIEVNSMPGFDIHEAPYSGRPFPVAEHLMRAMFDL